MTSATGKISTYEVEVYLPHLGLHESRKVERSSLSDCSLRGETLPQNRTLRMLPMCEDQVVRLQVES